MSNSQNAARSAGKLIVLTSHPIQYQAPLWRALAEELGTGHRARGKGQEDDEQGGGVAGHFDSDSFDFLTGTETETWKGAAEDGGAPFEVWFLTDQGVRHTEDKDFGKAFAWDVDLLSGYPHRFLELQGKWDLRKFNGIPLAKPIGESLRAAGATALWVEGWRFKPFWDAVSAAKKMGIPVFLRGETSDKIAEKGGVFGLIRNFALHRLFSKVDYFLAIGQASRRFYLKHGVPERKLVDAPYCVDNEFFRAEAGKIRGTRQEARGERGAQGAHFDKKHFEPSNSETAPRNILTDEQKVIREEWKIPLDAKVVMFCGKFVGKKRPGDLVKAARAHFDRSNFDNLKDKQQALRPWHLLFVGSGELGEELRAACGVVYDADCQIDKISKFQNAGPTPASFVGFLNQSKICKAYAIADAVVLPSEAWETWGLVVNEATAAGVPTVVSDQCGCSEDFASKNPYTRCFPMSDVPAMVQAIEEVLALEAKPEDVTRPADVFSPLMTARAVAEKLRGWEKGRITCR